MDFIRTLQMELINARFRGSLILCGLMLFTLLACTEEQGKVDSKDGAIASWSFEAVEKSPTIADHTINGFAYMPKEGDTAQYKVTQINMVKRGNLSLEQEITQSYTKVIKKINPDGSIEMNIRIDSMIVNEKGPNPQKTGETISLKYNSGNDSDRKNKDFIQYNSVIGAQVSANVSKLGKVEEVLGLNTIVNQMLGAKKDSIPEKMKEQLMQQVKAQFFQLPMQQEYQTFPDKGVLKKERTWTKVDVIPVSGILTVTNSVTYTMGPVHEFNGRKVAIVKAVLTAKTEIPKDLPKFIQFSLNKSTFQGTGSSIVDVVTGETILKKNDVLTEMDASIKDLRSGEKQEVKQQIKTIVSVAMLR